jgi:hypothetical protein
MAKKVVSKKVDLVSEEKLQVLRQDFFSYYRRLRSNLFSDTETVYETKLTKEVFDLKLQQLSQDKKQSEFENLALAIASRLVTPNIKPQTGPDGGGDGKVDGETYPVDRNISDQWWVSDGCVGEQKWAIAISVQKTWQNKIKGDTKKVVETGRGYSKLLFFTNQKIKSSTRHAKEDALSKQYGITVSIFDGNWFSFAVFEQGCLDLAVEKLNFSDDYRKKIVVVGSNDKTRAEKLKELENSFLTRSIVGLDTQYVEDLLDTCLLSRGLGKPRIETEGRFNRALREASKHGTAMQTFNIIYNHAWTSFFWFNDIDATYEDYLKLKDFTSEYPSVHTVERLTNILTNLENVAQIGLFDINKFIPEVKFIIELRKRSELSLPCQLFLDIYFSEHRLFQLVRAKKNLSAEIKVLSELLEKSANYPDISFDAQLQIIDMLGRVVADNEDFENMVDRLAEISSARESELQGATMHFNRAKALMENENFVAAVKHLGRCVQSFLKEGHEEEYIKSCGFMGIALYSIDLPYSAEAYLVKSASMLVRDYYTKGTIPHLLLTVLSKLCEIELMLGRLVMYLNWRELLFVIANNNQEFTRPDFIERDTLEDGGWCCRFATTDITKPEIAILPDILLRCDMLFSANYLKYALGYKDEVDERFSDLAKDNWIGLLKKQPISDQFLCDLNIATDGKVTLDTLALNCRFFVTYDNSVKNQVVAETFLASIETLLATFGNLELVILCSEVKVVIEEVEEPSSMDCGISNGEYVFHVNHDSLDEKGYWSCFAYFMAHFMSSCTVSKDDIETLIADRQKKEKIIDRVSSLMQLNKAVYYVLGTDFKYSLSKWQSSADKNYHCLVEVSDKETGARKPFHSSQQNMSIYTISSNMQWWNDAIWKGVGLIMDRTMQSVPVLALFFRNITEGKKIIKEWKEKQDAGKPGIEVQIIKGINKNHPTWYRVCIAPEIPSGDIKVGRYMAMMCRKHTMTPNNTFNVDALEHLYLRFGSCLLTALAIDDNNRISMPDSFDEAIELKRIIIQDAWRVSIHDITRNALEWDDDPFIPDSEITTAPVLELLAEMREVHYKMNKE